MPRNEFENINFDMEPILLSRFNCVEYQLGDY